jgi:hypothetical protein
MARMVESPFVDSDKPIGILSAISKGFDRVTARPHLVAPPLLLDLFLWLGPQLRISSLIQEFFDSAQSLISGQAELFPAAMREALVEGFNLLSALSSFPIGIPSVMAGRMPLNRPLGIGGQVEVSEVGMVLVLWLAMTAIGLGLGAFYQLWIASAIAPEAELGSGWVAALRMIGLGAVLFLAGLVVGTSVVLASGIATLILPLLGFGVLALGWSLLVWLLIYVAFAPHGIIRYDLGVFRAIIDSFVLVRWNLLSTVGFLLLAIGSYWILNVIWGLPEADSWFSLLGILGHAFVSTTLLAASYAFYQGRREWLLSVRFAENQHR